MPGLWRFIDGKGKFNVFRRNGEPYPHPCFVLGAKDPAAPAALRCYALVCAKMGMDKEYVEDILKLSDEFVEYAKQNGHGDPTEPPAKE